MLPELTLRPHSEGWRATHGEYYQATRTCDPYRNQRPLEAQRQDAGKLGTGGWISEQMGTGGRDRARCPGQLLEPLRIHRIRDFPDNIPISVGGYWHTLDRGPEGAAAFGGLIRDPKVTRIVTGNGLEQDVTAKGYYLFSVRNRDWNDFCPARALDADGKVLYELLRGHGFEWRVPAP